MTIKTVVKNTEGRDFIVGDLHGCLDELYEKLSAVKFHYTKDRLFSVGDLVDRGDDSFNCLKLIDYPWFHCVKGNHEVMMIEVVLGDIPSNFHTQSTWLWYRNGGKWAEEFYNPNTGWSQVFKEYVEKVDRLPLSIEIVDEEGSPLVGICHAQPLPDWEGHYEELTKNEIEYILWQRDLINYTKSMYHGDTCDNIPLVYCGHTPCVGVKQVGNVRFIDTGACFKGGLLTVEEIIYD
jgi:serine/threonine protein phosphatase 1